MTIIDYRRSVLTVVRMASTTPEELLQFLGGRGQSYELLSRGGAGAPLRLRNRATGKDLLVPRSSYLVWDPEHGGFEIYPSANSLRAIGIDPARISSNEYDDCEPDWLNFD